MKKFFFLPVLFLAAFLFLWQGPVTARAGARFYLDPASGNYQKGQTFTVTVWVDPAGKPVQTMDVIIDYDKSRLSTSEAAIKDEKYFGSNGDSVFNVDQANGRLSLYFFVTQSTYSRSTKGKVVSITFTAQETGTAAVNFICGSDDGSAIRNSDDGNFIDCAANGSGNYTIAASGGGTSTTPTPAPTAAPTASELPETGGATSPTPTAAANSSSSSALPNAGWEQTTLAIVSAAGLFISLGIFGLIF